MDKNDRPLKVLVTGVSDSRRQLLHIVDRWLTLYIGSGFSWIQFGRFPPSKRPFSDRARQFSKWLIQKLAALEQSPSIRIFQVNTIMSHVQRRFLRIANGTDDKNSHNIYCSLPKLEGLDQIYNLACPASPVHYQKDPISTLNTCFLGTRNLLELARSSNIRILHTSTSGK
jgi:hypothetical protein